MTLPQGRPPKTRREAIDFWRGFVLCTIFVNHVPGNLFESFTFRNIGFSDSAEAFVFISGLAMALSYGTRFTTATSDVIGKLARRAFKLYSLHIGLSLSGLAIFATGAALAKNADLMGEHGRDLFVDDPTAALIGLFSLGHQLGYFNILPLYVLLVAMVPAFLWMARTSVAGMLAASLGLYAAARLDGWTMPSWPLKGEWFLNPFAWQLLMAIGIAVGLHWRSGSLPRNRWLVGASAVVLAGAAICATDGLGLVPGLMDDAHRWADLDKTSLGLGRLAHFMALAYLVYAIDLAGALRHFVWFQPLCAIGRNGLWSFALLSLLAALDQVLAQTFGHSSALDTLLIGSGLAVIYGSAWLLDHGRFRDLRAAAPLTTPF